MTLYNQQQVTNNDDPCYWSSTTFFTPLASPTDIWEIKYGGSKLIQILGIWISYWTNVTSGIISDRVYILKRSTAASRGTPTTETIVPSNSNSATAGAVVSSFQSGSNPTTGTLVGCIKTCVLFPLALTNKNTGNGGQSFVPLFQADSYIQPIKLVSSGQSVVVNFNGVTLASASPSVSITCLWKEI